ncbi:uncharacterized protein AC631_00721 [Debaryomyces fabryi]|uniref:Decapping nuclease n=1 Tax=Debaryomyces fabryi TaxID=58627 RepID=A0A0V1Q4Z3_9ASCO|nr:uncharacterized protein AC631_00721 [Debaryomyces fabryi]KSA03582.1 hypothetical protein AC631_00721 [Debaryomyces fabryi]CUM54329.1 unnamed protein product [Debaryomyces fabryi]
MKELPLSLFNKLSNQYSKDETIEDEIEKLICSIGSLPDEKPTELLHYTRTVTGEIKPNDKQGLKLLNIPIGKGKKLKSKTPERIIGSDLTTGYQGFKKASASEIYQLDGLFTSLKYYLDNAENKQKSYERIQSSIMSLRRNLLMLMLIPLNHWKEYRFNVIYWKGMIILDYDWEYFEDDINIGMSNLSLSRRNNTELLQYTGFKFEDLITLAPDKSNDFYTLVSQNFDNFNTIFTAEVDAGIDDATSLSSYVELKTHSQTKSQIDFKLSSKLMSSWCQTKLVDGKHVIIGFRSKSYNLTSIKKYQTNEISNLLNLHPLKLADNSTITCKKLVRWYKCVLKWIIDLIREDSEVENYKVYKIHYSPKNCPADSSLFLEPINDETRSDIFNQTIPQWFQEYINVCTEP